ncbi:MAG TPA: hypothetical protein VGO56_15080 [Pyrinomonadaceae bacterium]|nr:hypothetical protein [Pyrinomonadaceae bacterium]
MATTRHNGNEPGFPGHAVGVIQASLLHLEQAKFTFWPVTTVATS